MSTANQIGFGMCLALIPYMIWSAAAPIVGKIWDRIWPPTLVPNTTPLYPILTDLHIRGVLTEHHDEPDDANLRGMASYDDWPTDEKRSSNE